ncbi:SEC-C metal-binding domain-containing protein, partial [Aureimonas sp. SK2]|uniref:SEC-C metal-binding domain-containing protein n=1 Tax=Aureimonas sp. SK2 TaxID=3015992 RepID=UPI0024447441
RFRYRLEGRDHVQREIATFRQIDGRWFYDTSEINPKSSPVKVERIGRNDPCSCGSGKKHKKCCGNSPGTGAA